MAKLTLEQCKKEYLADLYAEMNRIGISEEDIPKVIGKTGFMSVFEEFPEEQLHVAIKNAVTEILVAAATN